MPLAAHMSPLLRADQLSLERGGRQLFSNLTFEVNPGDLIQLAGDNGAGKTSLLRILAGLSRYGFDGAVQRFSAQLFLGHQAGVKGLLTPRENLAWHVGGQASGSDEDIEQALAKVGLFGYEDVPSHNLSAGQHRRVNLARLYLSQCPLWLLDEPFTAIDRSGVASLEALVVDRVINGGAVILTSHQPLQLDHPLSILDLKTGLGT
jgi:heme exporter protein A